MKSLNEFSKQSLLKILCNFLCSIKNTNDQYNPNTFLINAKELPHSVRQNRIINIFPSAYFKIKYMNLRTCTL